MKYFLVALLSSLPLFGAAVDQTAASKEIDRLVAADLAAHELEPNAEISDELFVRRIYLDLVGRIPTKAETTAFLESDKSTKRSELISKLIGSEGYTSHMYHFWADLLRARTSVAGNNQSRPAGMVYEQWIKDAITENKPYDEMAYELVTARGSAWDNPAVGFYLRDFGMPLDNLAITTQVFMGTQIVCAQCHDHPFESWTQMDYYHLAAFTYPIVTSNNHANARKAYELFAEKMKEKNPKAKIPEKSARDLRRAFSELLIPVRFNNVAEVNRALRLPHDYQYDDAKPKAIVQPATLMAPDAVLSEDGSKVEAFGEWLTSRDNPRFTTVIANRYWKKVMGIGLIEPVDDIKEYTRAFNPELMTYLEELLKDLDYDLQAYHEILVNTATYQREASREEVVPGAKYHFPGPVLRRMTAEQIWDSLVAMVIENPDLPDPGREVFTDRRMGEAQLVAEAVYDQAPAEFLASGRAVQKIQRELSVQIEAATAELLAAREAEDPEAIKASTQKARELRASLKHRIEKEVYRDHLREKAILVAANGTGDDPFLARFLAAFEAEDKSVEERFDEIAIPDHTGSTIDSLIAAMYADDAEALRTLKEAEKAQQRKEWATEIKVDRKGYSAFLRASESIKRASDLGSPARPGHFLREFGQSDRELVDNSSDNASITQALAMLNGPMIHSLGSRFSVLGRSLGEQKFHERIRTIYLTMLSREPTAEEKKIFQEAWQADPESGTVKGIVWALLNTRQFLFVQ